MNVLPRLLYLLQALPVKVPQQFIKLVRSEFIRFMWSDSRARVSRKILTLPKSHGGIGFPDPGIYHQAVHLTRIADWCCNSQTKQWVDTESSLAGFPIGGAPWIKESITRCLSTHPTIAPTLKVFRDVMQAEDKKPFPSPLTPILGHPSFQPGFSDANFVSWGNKKKHRAMDLSSSDSWKIPENTDLPEGCWPLTPWNRRQLSHFLTSLPPVSQFHRELTYLEKLCISTDHTRGTLSHFYKYLISPKDSQNPSYILKWEKDLQVKWTQSQIDRIIKFTHKASICNSYQEINYKILTRWYHTPVFLSKVYPTCSDVCWRCNADKGSLFHIFWNCPLIQPFWKKVTDLIFKLTDINIESNAAACLLHLTPMAASKYKNSLTIHLLSTAKACIAHAWKQVTPPCMETWFARIEAVRQMEDLTADIYDRRDTFKKTWFYWMEFRYSRDFPGAAEEVGSRDD